MTTQTECLRLTDESGNLTEDGIFFARMYLDCKNIAKDSSGKIETEFDRIMKIPEEKAKLEKLFGKELN